MYRKYAKAIIIRTIVGRRGTRQTSDLRGGVQHELIYNKVENEYDFVKTKKLKSSIL